MYVGQTEVPSCMAKCQVLVIESKQSEHRRVQIMNMNRILYRSKPELISSPIGLPPFYPTANQQRGESMVVVVAP